MKISYTSDCGNVSKTFLVLDSVSAITKSNLSRIVHKIKNSQRHHLLT